MSLPINSPPSITFFFTVTPSDVGAFRGDRRFPTRPGLTKRLVLDADTCTRAEERVTSRGKKKKNENNDGNYAIRLIERTNAEKPVNAFKSFASGRHPGTRPVGIVVIVGTRRRRPTRDNNYRTRAGKFPVGSPNEAVSGRNGRRVVTKETRVLVLGCV